MTSLGYQLKRIKRIVSHPLNSSSNSNNNNSNQIVEKVCFKHLEADRLNKPKQRRVMIEILAKELLLQRELMINIVEARTPI